MNVKGTRIGKTILKKNKWMKSVYSILKHSIATVIKTLWYWQRGRYRDQWNRTDNPEIGLHRYAQLIFDKSAKGIQWKKDGLFNEWYQRMGKKGEPWPFKPQTLYKSELRVDRGLKCKEYNYGTSRGEIWEKLYEIKSRQRVLRQKAWPVKEKTDEFGPQQNEKHLLCKRPCWEDDKTRCRGVDPTSGSQQMSVSEWALVMMALVPPPPCLLSPPPSLWPPDGLTLDD